MRMGAPTLLDRGFAVQRPRCVVVAGPNGAGKSSVAPFLVKELFGIGRYVNPDVIAAGLSGFDPSTPEELPSLFDE
jgi:predicted ABC-type ATPase